MIVLLTTPLSLNSCFIFKVPSFCCILTTFFSDLWYTLSYFTWLLHLLLIIRLESVLFSFFTFTICGEREEDFFFFLNYFVCPFFHRGGFDFFSQHCVDPCLWVKVPSSSAFLFVTVFHLKHEICFQFFSLQWETKWVCWVWW